MYDHQIVLSLSSFWSALKNTKAFFQCKRIKSVHPKNF